MDQQHVQQARLHLWLTAAASVVVGAPLAYYVVGGWAPVVVLAAAVVGTTAVSHRTAPEWVARSCQKRAEEIRQGEALFYAVITAGGYVQPGLLPAEVPQNVRVLRGAAYEAAADEHIPEDIRELAADTLALTDRAYADGSPQAWEEARAAGERLTRAAQDRSPYVRRRLAMWVKANQARSR